MTNNLTNQLRISDRELLADSLQSATTVRFCMNIPTTKHTYFMEYFNNKLCISGSELIRSDKNPDGLMTKQTYDYYAQRNRLGSKSFKIVRRSTCDTPALIEFDSLPQQFRHTWLERHGDRMLLDAPSEKDFWNAAASALQVLRNKGISHTLPDNPVHLKRLYGRYRKSGYRALIHSTHVNR